MHLKEAKRVMRYVKGTYGFGIKFTGSRCFHKATAGQQI